MKFKLLIAVMLSLNLLADDSPAAHFLVVDQEGVPVPGAKVMITWWSGHGGWYKGHETGRVVREQPTSDKDGRFALDLSKHRSQNIRNVVAPGFFFERRLNPYLNVLLQWLPNTPETPYKIVMRRALEEKEHLLGLYPHYRYSMKEGEKKTFPISVFGGNSTRNARDDFFLEPHFDARTRKWHFDLWTTNETTGIIASTNRVFYAPETGYKKRIRVEQEEYLDRSFTLYLKMHEPQIFVMFEFGLGDLVAKGNENSVYCEFACRCYRVNPFGGRTFEQIRLTRPVARYYDEIMKRFLKSLVEDHRYPPRPDVVRFEANCERREKLKELYRDNSHAAQQYCNQISELKYGSEHPTKEDEKKMAELAVKEKFYGDKAVAFKKELMRLEEEAPTLILPETPVSQTPQLKHETEKR